MSTPNDYAPEPLFSDDFEDVCEVCGGDGLVEYMDHPECWGEDCPSELNHLIPCPECVERERRAKQAERRKRRMTQAQVDEWNGFFPEGSPCIVRKDDGTEIETRTRSPAWLVSGDHPVVLIAKFTGGYSLDRLRMLETHRL